MFTTGLRNLENQYLVVTLLRNSYIFDLPVDRGLSMGGKELICLGKMSAAEESAVSG